jgi:hypothetical protein
MKAWFKALAPDEQARRGKFSAAFDPDRKTFMALPLSTARNVSLHRKGFAPVVVRFKGFFGVAHVGTPVKHVPVAESRPAEIGGDLPWLSTSMPLRPNWSDFSIDGKPLFDECREYLTQVSALTRAARSHAQLVHGRGPLTLPP